MGINPADLLTTIGSAQPCNASKNFDQDVGAFRFLFLQITWESLNTFDNTFTIWSSADGVTYQEENGSTITPAAAAGVQCYDFDTKARGFMRIAYTKGTAAAGTYTIKMRQEVPPQ